MADPKVIYVTASGVARLERERMDCARLLGRAAPPAECGAEIPVAPARGPMVSFTPRATVITDAGNLRVQNDGYQGRRAARALDAFDRMTVAAKRAHRGDGAFVPPFTVGQVEVGRDYAALTERVDASGVKCSSLEALRASGGGGGSLEEAVLRDVRRLRAYHARIGDGLAIEVRRIRPDGTKRRAIHVRRLVDQVCLGDQVLGDVLAAHGWAVDAKARDALRRSLAAALDRMRGYDLVRV